MQGNGSPYLAHNQSNSKFFTQLMTSCKSEQTSFMGSTPYSKLNHTAVHSMCPSKELHHLMHKKSSPFLTLKLKKKKHSHDTCIKHTANSTKPKKRPMQGKYKVIMWYCPTNRIPCHRQQHRQQHRHRYRHRHRDWLNLLLRSIHSDP
ncbi:hypothetical protein O181_032903 [Austropuccinia psidii MF-1]|uniref:Uncharacterized protein n=1 Tax=Austropuccinia psidii MF-1 TaxID=1389203 RepID=A0A9Q3D0E5_9BASI|nr:hypothetical protein [Austropuccinia psidii MF-1]